MQAFLLAIMRFCLSAWVGISVFFVVVIADVVDSLLTDRITKYNHPTVFLPPYFGFAFALLGTGVVCAFLGLWNARIGLIRRFATLAFVFAALGMATVDYARIYRKIDKILANPDAIPASQLVMLYRQSRMLKGVVLGWSIAAASLAIWPVKCRNDATEGFSMPGPAGN